MKGKRTGTKKDGKIMPSDLKVSRPLQPNYLQMIPRGAPRGQENVPVSCALGQWPSSSEAAIQANSQLQTY
jgi:hypothetical protein